MRVSTLVMLACAVLNGQHINKSVEVDLWLGWGICYNKNDNWYLARSKTLLVVIVVRP